MLDLRLFQNPRFAVSSGGITLVFFAMFGSFFMLAQYLQGVHRLLAARRRGPAAAVLGGDDGRRAEHAEAGRPLRRQPGRRVGLGLGRDRHGRHALFFDVDTSYWDARHDVHPRRRHGADDDADDDPADGGGATRPCGMGSATNDTTRELGGALGVAVLGSLLTGQFTSGVGPAVASCRPTCGSGPKAVSAACSDSIAEGEIPRTRRPLVSAAKQSFVDGLGLATTVSAAVVAIAAVLVYRFLPSDRNSPQVTGEAVPALDTASPNASSPSPQTDLAISGATSRRRRPGVRLGMPMRIECKHFESRTYRNGETVRKCDLDLAPDAPWRCPDDCPKYERRLADRSWTYGSLVTPPTPDEPASVADGSAAAILDEAEDTSTRSAPGAWPRSRPSGRGSRPAAGGALLRHSRRADGAHRPPGNARVTVDRHGDSPPTFREGEQDMATKRVSKPRPTGRPRRTRYRGRHAAVPHRRRS